MTTTKSKPQSLSARRTSPRTFSKPLPNRKFSPGTDGIPRTPFSGGAITPVAGTLKSVTLSDWWLTKKKSFCIEGFESVNGSVARRLFSSATISKRDDSTNLVTIDGIKVCISGFINRSRSLQNGISLEVCNRFLLGFPYNWKEEVKEESLEKKSILFDDDIPMSRLQDLLMSSLKSKVLDDVVDSLRDLTCTTKSDYEDDDGKKLVPLVLGVKTRGMLRQREENEASIGERLHSKSKKKKKKKK